MVPEIPAGRVRITELVQIVANAFLEVFGTDVCFDHSKYAGSLSVTDLIEELFDALTNDARDRLVVRERFQAAVKGVDAPLSLVRVALRDKAIADAPASGPRASGMPQSIRRI